MDTLGKIALVGGIGLLTGAAIQKAVDNYDESEERRRRERDKLENTIRDQKHKIDMLQLDHDDLRHQIKELESRNRKPET